LLSTVVVGHALEPAHLSVWSVRPPVGEGQGHEVAVGLDLIEIGQHNRE